MTPDEMGHGEMGLTPAQAEALARLVAWMTSQQRAACPSLVQLAEP